MAGAVQPILMFTDFGLEGPYIGQVLAVFQRLAPDIPVFNLFADAPVHNPRASAYLLAAYAPAFPVGSVFFCVVDPGVGSGKHRPLILQMDGRWFVGPDNGLFQVLAQRSAQLSAWPISWRPEQLSASFHGRDLYAPTAAQLATGNLPADPPEAYPGIAGWPDDLAEIVYIDHYGNAMTGLRATSLSPAALIDVHGQLLCRADTFSQVQLKQACWYENSNGLVELALNCARAEHVLGVSIGTQIKVLEKHAPPS